MCQITSKLALEKKEIVRFRHAKMGHYGVVFGIITGGRKEEKYSGDVRLDHGQSLGYWSNSKDSNEKNGSIVVDGHRVIGPSEDLFI